MEANVLSGDGERRQAVRGDLYDIWAYRLWLRRYPPLARLALGGAEILPFFFYLLEDIFRLLYKEEVALRYGDEILTPHHLQRDIIARLQIQGWVAQLRPATMLREEEAIYATELLGRALLDLAQGVPEGQGALKDLSFDQLGELLRRALQEAAREKEREGPAVDEQLQTEVTARLGAGSKHLVQELREQSAGKARPQEVEDAENALGGTEAGSGGGRFYSADDRQEFAEALKWLGDLRRFAKALGRLLKTSFFKRLEYIPEGAEELYEVEQGRDLRRVLPSELVKLAHPVLRKLFWLSYASGNLLLYRLRSRSPLGKGAKIFIVDLSTSTRNNAVRQTLEKLIMVGTLLSSKRGEAYRVIYFNDTRELPVFDLSNPPTVEQWVDIATRYGQGGTDATRPLRVAARFIETDPRFRNADVVFFTDGEIRQQTWWPSEAPWRSYDDFVREFLEKKKELGFTFVTVLIDWYGGVEEEHVARFSDRVIRLTELLTKEELKEITALFKKPSLGA